MSIPSTMIPSAAPRVLTDEELDLYNAYKINAFKRETSFLNLNKAITDEDVQKSNPNYLIENKDKIQDFITKMDLVYPIIKKLGDNAGTYLREHTVKFLWFFNKTVLKQADLKQLTDQIESGIKSDPIHSALNNLGIVIASDQEEKMSKENHSETSGLKVGLALLAGAGAIVAGIVKKDKVMEGAKAVYDGAKAAGEAVMEKAPSLDQIKGFVTDYRVMGIGGGIAILGTAALIIKAMRNRKQAAAQKLREQLMMMMQQEPAIDDSNAVKA